MNNLLKVWYHMENAFFVEFPTMDIEDLHVNNFG